MTLVSAGWNELGQLGREGDCKAVLPVDIPPSDFKSVAAGQLHSIAVTNNGEVYGWGSCEDGGLGFPGKANIETPTKLEIDQKIQSASCGFCNTILLAESGDVIIITDGEPWKADLPEQAILVCCGYYTLWAVGRSGAVYQCGSAPEEEITKYEVPVKPVQIVAGNGYTVIVGEDGCGYGIGDVISNKNDSGTTFLPIESLKGIKIKKVSSFDSHCIAITESGQAYAFGNGGQGCLGLGNCETLTKFTQLTCFGSNKVIDASTGSSHTCFIISDNSVYGCGNNEYGQALVEDSAVYLETPKQSNKIANCTSISCGGNHTIAIINGNKKSSSNEQTTSQKKNEDHPNKEKSSCCLLI